MIEIREARFEDCAQILELLTQLQEMHAVSRPDIFKEGQVVMGENDFENILSDSDRIIYVAEMGNRLIGMVEIEFKEVLNPILVRRKVGIIDSIIVEKEMRNQGFGGLLFEEAKKAAENRGVESLELNVWGFNESAIQFYEKSGMKILRTTMELKLNMFHVKQ